MPTTRIQRVLFGGGIVAVVLLWVLPWPGGGDTSRGAVPLPQRAAHVGGTSAEAKVEEETFVARVAPTTLTITAVDGTCWLQARRGSEQGRILREIELARGEAVRVSATRLWVRLGAAANVTALVNGRRLRDLPYGTVDLTLAGGRLVSET